MGRFDGLLQPRLSWKRSDFSSAALFRMAEANLSATCVWPSARPYRSQPPRKSCIWLRRPRGCSCIMRNRKLWISYRGHAAARRARDRRVRRCGPIDPDSLYRHFRALNRWQAPECAGLSFDDAAGLRASWSLASIHPAKDTHAPFSDCRQQYVSRLCGSRV